jgi:hypothetical protein
MLGVGPRLLGGELFNELFRGDDRYRNIMNRVGGRRYVRLRTARPLKSCGRRPSG